MSFHYPLGSGSGGAITIGTAVTGGTPNEILFVDGSTNVAESTDLLWNDTTKVFKVQSGGNPWLRVDPTGATSSGLGDINAQGNHTQFNLDDSSQLIGLYGKWNGSSPVRFVSASFSTGVAGLGDVDNVGNHTNLLVDDANQVISASKKLDMTNHYIQNVLDPVNPQDAATLSYVNSFVNGLSWKTTVAAATITTLPANTYANGASGVGATLTENANGAFPTIDGYAASVSDRILIQNEASALKNGIYVVTDAGSAGTPFILTRATDNDTSAEMTSATVTVTNGSTLAGKAFTQTSSAPTMGTTAINWVVFLNSVYTAGTGLTLTTNVFSLNTSHANDWLAVQTFESGMLKLAGATSGLLTMNAGAITSSYTVTWPTAQGAANTVPVNNGSGVLSWTGVTSAMLSAQTINAQVGTTYTFVLTDAQEMVTLTNASAITATVPTNASVAFPVGTQIDVVQGGAGKVTFVAAGGVTINSQSSLLSIAAQYVGVSLKKTATNTWLLLGNLIV